MNYELCHDILLYCLGYYIELNKIILIKVVDIKYKHNELYDIFHEFCLKNDFKIYDNDVVKTMIGLFISIIITMITYKNCKNIITIISEYKNYVYIFKSNLDKNFKHKLNQEYENFKDYSTNNIINEYFRGLNKYINYLLNHKPMDVMWI